MNIWQHVERSRNITLNSNENLFRIEDTFSDPTPLNCEFLLSNGEIDISWMSRSQKKIYEVLKNESNRNKSVYEIVELAGYKWYSAWYQAIKDNKYKQLLNYIGVDIQCIAHNHINWKHEIRKKCDDIDTTNIYTLDTSWMTNAQKNYYNVLKDEENCKKPIIQIANLAGYKDKTSWYYALENERFRHIVKSLGVDISVIERRYKGTDEVDLSNLDNFNTSWMSDTQKKFFKLLKIEENRKKPVETLVSLSGIKTKASWTRALLSERFRNLLSLLGIEITHNPQEIRNFTQDELDEFKKMYSDIDPSQLENINTKWMSRCQQKIYDVLRVEDNRTKPISEILALAGYKSSSTWHLALGSEKFRYVLTLMGITISQSKMHNTLDNIETYNIIDYSNINNIDTSWMTNAQKKFFEILKDPNNINLTCRQISDIAGYKRRDNWYNALQSERFANLLISMGVELQRRSKAYPSHSEIEYIKNPEERRKHLNEDVWDIRKLFKEYPLHIKAYRYIVDFRYIESPPLRKIIKKYYENMLANWKPLSFNNKLYLLSQFFQSLYDLFPDISSLRELKRDIHIEPVLQNMYCNYTNAIVNASLNSVRAMFKYMYFNRWELGPDTSTLIIDYDIPVHAKVLPKPIPPLIKYQLDEYLESVIVPLLETGKETPIVAPMFWDMIIILRYTGRRYEDLAHLIADGTDKDCLRYDLDGDPQLFTDHRIAKIDKDIVVPLAHLKDANGKNIVEQAILRQKKRVSGLGPATADDHKYLFRRIKVENLLYAADTPLLDKNGEVIIETIDHDYFSDCVLDKICKYIPLINENNDIYKITPHQFRHTVATEMIDAGIDIYAVKEFLGHSSVTMTERYIKVYQLTLKKQIMQKLGSSDAVEVVGNLPEQKEVYNNKWVKNKIIGVFELGDGCCEHPYKMSSCPHMVVCKICFKRKVRPDHKNSVIETINSYTTNREQFISFGLSERAAECDKIINFYKIALDVISTGNIFDPKIHLQQDFYNS